MRALYTAVTLDAIDGDGSLAYVCPGAIDIGIEEVSKPGAFTRQALWEVGQGRGSEEVGLPE